MKPMHAAVARIRDSEGRVLVLKRLETDRAFPGGWCLPGGRQEIGETIEDALCREVIEETGLTVTKLHFLYRTKTESADGLLFIVDCYDAEVTGEVVISSEHEAWQYISFEEACKVKLNLAGPLTRNVMGLVNMGHDLEMHAVKCEACTFYFPNLWGAY